MAEKCAKIAWCYYCNQKGHEGIDCQEQRKIFVPSGLDPEVRKKWSRGREGVLKVGDPAPNCRVWSIPLKREIDLFDNSWEKPIVLNFGSYSWLPWKNKTSLVRQIYEKHCNDAIFICVYILEAHAIDEWHLYTPVCFKQPRTLAERIKIAEDYMKDSNPGMPVVVDLLTDETEKAYAAFPERLYVIHQQKISFKSDRGPFGYHPEEVDDWMQNYLDHN